MDLYIKRKQKQQYSRIDREYVGKVGNMLNKNKQKAVC